MNYFVFLSIILHIVCSQEIGDQCQIPLTKSSNNPEGKCVILKDCPQAVAGLRKGKLPYICGYHGLEAIVCCTTSKPRGEIRVQVFPEKQDNSNRISRKECAEYGKYVYKMEPMFSENGQRMVNVSKCESNVRSFIEDSIYARKQEFPHMALIGVGPEKDKHWVCSGSLISEQFVLTAAHCTNSHYSGEVQRVRLGDLDFESPNDDSLYFDFSVVEIHRHPKFRSPVLYNDIALLELDRRVSFSEYIRPACLHSGSDEMLDKFIIAGWALIEKENRGHLRQYKQIRKIDNEECKEVYKNLVGRRLKNGIMEETMICTEEAKNDACRISSGAALQIHSNDVYCMYEIVGITSFGRGICASHPVVHTRVSAYIDWIESIVWPQVTKM